MAALKNAVIILLALATITSLYILAVDMVLWEFNPRNGHAYALIAFTVINLLLIGAVLAKPRTGLTITALWGTLQILLLIADVATGLGIGATPTESAAYLFLGEGAGVRNPSGYAVDILLLLYIALAIAGLRGRKTSSAPSAPK